MSERRPSTKRADQRRDTEARILASARRIFAESGYDRATIRAVAGDAGVNPGLVVHYFGTKENLFRRAASMTPDDSGTEAPQDLAEFLLGSLGVKLEDLPLASTAAMRSMLTHPEAAHEVRSLIDKQMRQLGEAIAADDADLRATLIGTTILGVVIGRHLLDLDLLRDVPPDTIIDLLRPCFRLLAGDADSAPPT